jgi:signal transduction histidine kinase
VEQNCLPLITLGPSEPFFRSERSRRQDIPGAGLGLTIAYEIIRRAGGGIEIANGPERGLVQTVRLPEHQPPRSAADASGAGGHFT